MNLSILFLLIFSFLPSISQSDWRTATSKELGALIPARAPVEKERIETEFRTASGVTNGKGKFIAGVVMITAGYAADGKYAQFFITQVGIKIGDLNLSPGEYVFGHKRIDDDTMEVKYYEAATGKYLGAVKAIKQTKPGPIRSLLITPPNGDKGTILIGRFSMDYKLDK